MTTTALAAYNRVQDMTAFTRELGESIAKSQMFGCESVAQGHVLAVECVAKNLAPLSLAERYHLIGGKLCMRSDAMLAGLQERGGKYRIIDRTAELAALEITYDGQTQVFSLSWQDAQQEPFTKNKKGAIKDNWATPRSRMQMLWARVVSDGVRTMCPIVLVGKYTPEEIGDFSDDNGSAGQADVVDAEYEVQATGAAASTTAAPTAPATAVANADEENDGNATRAQIAEIRQLYSALEVSHEQQEAALRKRGVSALPSLTIAQAQELLGKLREKAAAATAPVPLDSPCSQEVADRIKQQLAELSQTWDADIAKKVKARLKACGLDKITDMTIAEARQLEQSLSIRQMEAFFELSLQGHTKGK